MSIIYNQSGVLYSSREYSYSGIRVDVDWEIDIIDSLNLSDNTVRQSDTERSIVNSLSLDDSLSPSSTIYRKLNNTLDLIDSLEKSVEYSKSINDSLTLDDQLQTQREILREISETLGLSDNLDFINAQLININDTLSLTDELKRLVRFVGKTVTKFEGIENVIPLILSVKNTKSGFKAIIETKPNNISLQKTVAVFQESDILYNDSTITYNQAIAYGGVGRGGGEIIGQVPSQLDDIKPIIQYIGEI